MSKELEALNQIHETLSYYDSPNLLLGCFETIEIALKDYEIKKEFFDSTMPVLYEHKTKNSQDLDKKLKALEIIKKKEVDISCLLFDGLELYNENMALSRVLTQEEYDLLKEVLL